MITILECRQVDPPGVKTKFYNNAGSTTMPPSKSCQSLVNICSGFETTTSNFEDFFYCES